VGGARYEQSQNTIRAINIHTCSYLDYRLAMVFIYAKSAAANGVWCPVHHDDFAVMVIVVMLPNHTLIYYN
jgi:hypothetical protein